MIMLDSELSVRFLGIFDSQEFIEVTRIITDNHWSAVNSAKWVHDYMTTSTDLCDRGHVVFMAIPRVDDFNLGVQLINQHELCFIECTQAERNSFLRGHQAIMVILTRADSAA